MIKLTFLCHFLHQSSINSALYVVIVFVLACLCKFVWQIILLKSDNYDYSAYECATSYKLVAHFASPGLDLFQGDF